MGSRVSTRVRLSGVAFLMALAAGCGGGGGDSPAPSPIVPSPPASQLLDWNLHPAASVVLGQAAVDRADPAGELGPSAGSPAVSSDGRLYVSGGNLKVFEDYSAGGAMPQQDISFSGAVADVSSQGSKLVVVHADGVSIFNNSTTVTDVPDVRSSHVQGCDLNTMNNPQGAYLSPAGHLIVADYGNNRVLIWNPDRVPGTGELNEPSVVVGQRHLQTCDSNDGGGGESRSKFTLNQPRAVWSDGTRLIVADEGNHRILIWDNIPTEDFQPANHVLGQADFDGGEPNRGTVASEFTLCAPRSVDVNEFGQMAVADSCNHRVLVWDAVPRADFVAANHVLGQATFTANAEPAMPSAQNLKFPSGARFHERNLLVLDRGHFRVLVFTASN